MGSSVRNSLMVGLGWACVALSWMSLGAVGETWHVWNRWWESRDFHQGAVTIRAQVVTMGHYGSRRGLWPVTYAFLVDGRAFRGGGAVGYDTLQAIKRSPAQQRTVEVVYRPERPERSIVKDTILRERPWQLTLEAVLWCLGSFGAFLVWSRIGGLSALTAWWEARWGDTRSPDSGALGP